MTKRRRFASKALQYTYDRFIGRDPEKRALYEEALANAHVAMRLYQLRVKARLSQAQLASRVGTSRSVISRLEDADYEGHSLAMLRRIGAALNKDVEIRFVARRQPAAGRRRRIAPARQAQARRKRHAA